MGTVTEVFPSEYINTVKSLLVRRDVNAVVQFLQDAKESCKSRQESEWDPVPDMSPVGLAVWTGDLRLVNAVIAAGFAPNELSIVGGYSKRPIHMAICSGYTDIVKSLVEIHGVRVEEASSECNSALFWAIQSGSVDMVEYIVKAGADLATSESLHTAIELNQCAVCRYIMTRGVDINVKDTLGFTPLAYALAKTNNFLTHMLLDSGADISGVFTRGNTVVHLAVIAGSLGIVKRLISLGACPETQNKYGNTPLHIATLYGFYDIVHYLVVERNVCMNIHEIDNQTPFTMALNLSNLRIAELLLHAGYFPSKHECDRLTTLPGCGEELRCLIDVVSSPRTLKDLCIFKYRHFLGKDLNRTASFLPPTLVKDVLLAHIS